MHISSCIYIYMICIGIKIHIPKLLTPPVDVWVGKQLQLRKRLATGFEFVEKCSG